MRVRSALAVFAFGICAWASAASREECFPLDRLPKELQPQAEQILLDLLDSEALYTVVGGLKPMSSGWYSKRVPVAEPDWREMEAARSIAAAFRCGDEIVASIQPFHRTYEGERYLQGVVFHRPALRSMIKGRHGLFGRLGISYSSEPIQVVMAVDPNGTSDRSRAYGHLFGYPRHAVDFFVHAEEEQKRTGEFVKREFVSIPVFSSPTNRFVYAVPVGYQLTEDDLRLRHEAEVILQHYRRLRPQFVGPGKGGTAELLRHWFAGPDGTYSSENAVRTARRSYRPEHTFLRENEPVAFLQ